MTRMRKVRAKEEIVATHPHHLLTSPIVDDKVLVQPRLGVVVDIGCGSSTGVLNLDSTISREN